MTDERAGTVRIVLDLEPVDAFGFLFPWGNEDACRDIIEQTLDLCDAFDRVIVRGIVELDSGCPFSRIMRRLADEGNRDPSLGDIAVNAVEHAAGPRRDWRNVEYFRHVVALMVDAYRDDFARYDAWRCGHTTRAGRRCRNRVGGCPAHDAERS